eukprot:TRINITY_DN8120_c0_g2_i4.p1 TRINITY_DN8120_c0_g2~~TRINITY_DN8120_c0_g2_i4.p1  ORF type:complete len:804 (+),score=86.96 TRINITY_DN8120_c0_g2_i4:163-2574(+)
MTKEGLSEVQFEQDIAPFISRTFDPEDSGLVTIQQINNTEQIGIDAAESSSFSHLVKELVKGTMYPSRIPLPALSLDFGQLKYRGDIITQLDENLADGVGVRVFILCGPEGIGKSPLAVHFGRLFCEMNESSLQELYLVDMGGCSSYTSIICRVARCLGHYTSSDPDPMSFFVWIKRRSHTKLCIILDHVEKTSATFQSLALFVKNIMLMTTGAMVIITTRSPGIKSILVSQDMCADYIKEVVVEPLNQNQAAEYMQVFTAHFPHYKMQEALLRPSVINLISILHTRMEGRLIGEQLFTVEATLKVTLDQFVDFGKEPINTTLSLRISTLLQYLGIFSHSFDIHAALFILNGILACPISIHEVESVLKDLEDMKLVREISGRKFGQCFVIPDFIRIFILGSGVLELSTSEKLRVLFVKYFSIILLSAGSLLLYGNKSACYSRYDDHAHNIHNALFGPWVSGAMMDYVNIAISSHEVLSNRLSLEDHSKFLNRVLENFKKSPEKDALGDIKIAFISCCLAKISIAQHDSEAARVKLKDALEILRSLNQSNKLKETEDEIHKCMAIALELEAKLESQPLLMSKVYEIKRNLYGEHPETCFALLCLAEAYETENQKATAIDTYQQTQEMMEQVLGLHPAQAIAIEKVADELRSHQKYALAGHMYRKCLDIRLQTLGNHHALVGQSALKIVKCLSKTLAEKSADEVEEVMKVSRLAVVVLNVNHGPQDVSTKAALEMWDRTSRILSSKVDSCKLCARTFTLLTRRHRCRYCGMTICDRCTSTTNTKAIANMGFTTSVRICVKCAEHI